MGKITGFLEFEREDRDYAPVEERIRNYREFVLPLPQKETREQAARCIQCPEPLCAKGCPLANRIPEWLALAAAGDFIGAAALSRSTSNLPEVCSRVCPQERLCETSCILSAKGDTSVGATVFDLVGVCLAAIMIGMLM